jgi:5-methyltetrahydrofolate--homocysteine methyltransferase
LTLSQGFAVEPEQSTVAIVAHHPQASYFGMRSGRIPPDRAGAESAAEAPLDASRAG